MAPLGAPSNAKLGRVSVVRTVVDGMAQAERKRAKVINKIAFIFQCSFIWVL
jgi:hypothetical protein